MSLRHKTIDFHDTKPVAKMYKNHSLARKAVAVSPSKPLLHFHEIPTWQRDNEYLLSGYRPTSGSYVGSLGSIFEWHNETINIHSHTCGSVLFALFPLHCYLTIYSKSESAQPIDLLFFTLYFWGVSICFACSASCHIIWNHSEPVAAFGNQLDFCGIVLLMWGASIPSIHFGFICDPSLQKLHWILISLSAGGCIVFTMHPRFIRPVFRTYRAIMYACLGFSGLLFIVHGIMLHGLELQKKRFALDWMALMAGFNILGAVLYALRLPEKIYPYRFDFVGASHQLFHLLVLAAGLAHYQALKHAFFNVRQSGNVCYN